MYSMHNELIYICIYKHMNSSTLKCIYMYASMYVYIDTQIHTYTQVSVVVKV